MSRYATGVGTNPARPAPGYRPARRAPPSTRRPRPGYGGARPTPVRPPTPKEVQDYRRFARRALWASRPLRITPWGIVIGYGVELLVALLSARSDGVFDPVASGFTRTGYCPTALSGNYTGGPQIQTLYATPRPAGGTTAVQADNCLSAQSLGAPAGLVPDYDTNAFRMTTFFFSGIGIYRHRIAEVWSRDVEGEIVYSERSPAIAAPPSIGGLPWEWPVEVPLPPPFFVPGGLIAPNPLPVSPPLVKSRPSIDPSAPRGAPGRRIGYTTPRSPLDTWFNPPWGREIVIPGPGVGTTPGNQPGVSARPSPRTRNLPRRNRRNERETNKVRALPETARAFRAVLEGAMDLIDLVRMLWLTIPKEHRAKGRLNPYEMAVDLFKNAHRIDVPAAFCGFLAMELEDRIYGRLGQLSGRVGEMLNNPLGAQSLVASRRNPQHRLLERLGKENGAEWSPFKQLSDELKYASSLCASAGRSTLRAFRRS